MEECATREPLIKRAKKACLYCRSRKIRCDVESRDQPCSNCLTDDVECQVSQSKRGKTKSRRRLKTKAKNPKERVDTTQDAGPLKLNIDVPKAPASLCNVSPTHTAEWLDYGIASAVFGQHHNRDSASKGSATELDQRFLHQELTYVSLIGQEEVQHIPRAVVSPTNLSSTSRTPPEGTSPQTSPSSDFSRTKDEGLPYFIKPLPSYLTKEDIDYLRIKGALDIPSTSFLHALLHSYVQYVYPFMPSTDMGDIFAVLAGENVSISILLLQAIAFAAVAFVDMDEICKAGFSSRRVCRKIFYDKAKLLYDLDVEADKLTIIQATLMISYYSDHPGDNKGAWVWLGVAISLAQTLGMHRRAEYRVQSRKSSLSKRIWWSCYIRDRMLAIAASRPLRIKDAECNTPPLTLEDFDIIDSSIKSRFLDVDTQTTLAEMSIRAMELCKLITEVIELHFSVLSNEDSTPTVKADDDKTAAMLCLKSISPHEQLVKRLDERVQAWYRTLPAQCIFGARNDQRGSNPCAVNAASLHITYWAVVSALHRPQLRYSNNTFSIKKVEEAAMEISRASREMYKSRLGQYLPASTIPLQFPTIITHAKRLEIRKPTYVIGVLDSLFYTIKVIEELRDLYPAGDDGILVTRLVANQVGITLLYNQNSKLWGLEYRGVHYSPGSCQFPLDLNSNFGGSGLGDVSPQRSSSCHPSPLETNREPPPPHGTEEILNPIDPDELPSFDNSDAMDWSRLTDMLPNYDIDFEQSIGMLFNSDSLQDVAMGGQGRVF